MRRKLICRLDLIDVEEFEAAVAEAEKAKREKDANGFRENLEKANELYRGEFMSGIYEDWAEFLCSQ